MTEYTVHIEGWRPHTCNELMKAHWRNANRMKQSDAQMLGTYFYQAKIPKATGKRSVAITMTCGVGRGLDQDAVQKSLLDGLVNTGYLKDDSSIWMEFKGVTIQRGKRIATTIVLGDL